jgi:hypothetical protein
MNAANVCIPNIGPAQRRRRLVGGLVSFGVTFALAAYLTTHDIPRAWRLLIVIPALAAALGVLQAKSQTCIALAARGLRNMDDGDRVVEDTHQLLAMRAQSRRVYVHSFIVAAIMTTVVIAL